VSAIVAMLEQWKLANFKSQYQFVVRQYAIGKDHSVSVIWRGGFGLKRRPMPLQWIKEKLRGRLVEQSSAKRVE
jgi:hypothetical protein